MFLFQTYIRVSNFQSIGSLPMLNPTYIISPSHLRILKLVWPKAFSLERFVYVTLLSSTMKLTMLKTHSKD